MGRRLGIALGNLCNLVTVDCIIFCGNCRYNEEGVPNTLRHAYESVTLPLLRATIFASDLMHATYGAAKLALARLSKNTFCSGME